MTEQSAAKLADKYGRNPGHWCRIYYTAQLLLDWQDLLLYVRILREQRPVTPRFKTASA